METKYLDARIKKYEDWNKNGVIKYTEKLELIELKAIKKQLLIHSVVVPKGTLPKDIDFVSKESWELFDKYYDNETSNKHTKHWNFMEGIRIALKNRK